MAELARLELPNHLSIKWCRKCCSRIILLNVLDFLDSIFKTEKSCYCNYYLECMIVFNHAAKNEVNRDVSSITTLSNYTESKILSLSELGGCSIGHSCVFMFSLSEIMQR